MTDLTLWSEDLTVRQATSSDAPVIFKIHVDSVTNLCASHYSAEQVRRWFDGRSSQNYRSAIEHGAIWIAECAGVAVGYTEFWEEEITSLFVVSAMSGRGLGSRLLNFAIGRITKGHKGPIRLEATMNGQQFYQKHGFVTVGEGYLVRPSGLRLEIVHMERPGVSHHGLPPLC